MKKNIAFALALLAVVGCQSTLFRKPRPMKFGPPPPGYYKIIGEPVPNWTPEHLTPPARETQATLTWVPMGPKPIIDEFWSGNDDASGRVVSLAVDPTDGDVAYAASASGGLWKTTDGGATWTPKTDELSILNHGCVAIDPSNPNTIYLGTGEYTTQSTGDGLFRSIDGGDTWVKIATSTQVGLQCSKVMVDPDDSDNIHLTGRGGYVRSTDGGNSWTTEIAQPCTDLALDPVDPSIVYVARHANGIYKSTDGGDNFTQLGGGLPTTLINRIIISIAPSNPDVLYAAFMNPQHGLRGFYRTDDAGANWTELVNTPDFPSPQGWYDCFVGVDPTDEDTVYCGGVFPSYAPAGVIKSTDGGANWTEISDHAPQNQLHPDQHVITFGPDGRVWIGNDGGVWNSTDGGQNWFNCNNRLTVTQNYSIAVHPTDPALMMGGTQDNGTVGRDLGTDEWPQVIGGDGGFLAYDFISTSRRYTTYVYLTVYRCAPGCADITGPWSQSSSNVDFIAPLVMDPSDNTTLLGGTRRIWRTTNASGAANWGEISSDLGGGTIKSIAVGPPSGSPPSNNIYAGTNQVFFTSDASVWENRSSGLGSATVTDIMVDPTDTLTAYVSMQRSSGGRVFRTEDAGLNWTDMSSTLPSGVTPFALAIDWGDDPPGIYVGSGAGVWSSIDNGATWEKDGSDLPNVNIGDLFIDPVNRQITAGTYGRGAWRADLPIVVTCGDGVVDSPELCDTAILESEPGACPTDCTTGDPCLVGTLVGGGTCGAFCDEVEITLPANGDGCCPAGAHAANDDDCAAVCGNGICEPGEEVTCTPDCDCVDDDDCDDNYVCTDDQCSAGTCTYNPKPYGDIDGNGFINIFDLFCVLDGFGADFSDCTFEQDDIHGSCGGGPSCCPNGIINIFDLFAVLDAFGQIDPCCGG